MVVTQEATHKISWEAFQRDYLPKEDGYKYEWLNGIVIQTAYAVNQKNLYIIANLLDCFHSIKTINVALISGVDIFFGENYRKIDVAFFNNNQILEATNGVNIIPRFIIEIISTNDQMNYMHQKMNDYRDAKVAIVWHIFPLLQEVHVYYDGLNKMEVLKEKGVCTADSVVKGFKMTVNDIFKK